MKATTMMLAGIAAGFLSSNVSQARFAAPPLGWSSWNAFGGEIDENKVLSTADAVSRLGLKAKGYQYINIDLGWWTRSGSPHNHGRDAEGRIVPDRAKFPHGMAWVAESIHAMGLKAGIYTDSGTTGCGDGWGSYGHYREDIQQFADWGFDYLKVDMCGDNGGTRGDYEQIRDAIRATGRPMFFSICTWDGSAVAYGPDTGDSWRTGADITTTIGSASWADILKNFQQPQAFWWLTRPGAWNDPDMLVVGLKGVNDTEARAHLSMWAMLAAPLIAGNDLRDASASTLDILTNPEVIALDQDRLGISATAVHEKVPGLTVFSKPLGEVSGRRKAVMLLNQNDTPAEVAVTWPDIGLAGGSAEVRDLWARQDLGRFVGGYAAPIPAHGAALLTVEGKTPKAPQGIRYLSDLVWTYAANSWGPVERDRSNGERLSQDGHPLSIGGSRFQKGLGVHAVSDVRVFLGGKCLRFRSKIGVDDEVGGSGAVIFEVWLDGVKRFESPILEGGELPREVSVDLKGGRELRLYVRSPAPPGFAFDHADWADATIDCR